MDYIWKFYIVEEFDDWNEEWITISLFDESGKLLVSGNEFHDNINSVIKGFLTGVVYTGVDIEVIEARVKE